MKQYSGYLQVVLLVIAAMLLTQCAQSASPTTAPGAASPTATAQTPAAASPSPSGKQLTGTITVWTPEYPQHFETIAKEFEAQHPGVTVKVVGMPWGEAHTKLLTGIAGGQTPDVAVVGTTWVAELAKTGALAPLPESMLARKGEFFDSAWSLIEVDQTPFGVPWYVDVRVIYYRTDIFKQAGFDQPGETWDEFKATAKALKEKAGARYAIALPTKAFQDLIGPFLWQAGGTIYDEAGFHLDTPEMVEALTFFQFFFKEGLAPAPGASQEGLSSTQLFIRGDIPMLISGPWTIGELKKQGGEQFSEQWSVALMPKNKARTSFVGGGDLVVFKQSQNPDLAWAFIDYMTHPEVQAKWYSLTGDLPSVQAAWDLSPLAGDAKLQVFRQQLEDAKGPPPLPHWEEVNAKCGEIQEKVAANQLTPEQAAQQMQQVAESVKQ